MSASEQEEIAQLKAELAEVRVELRRLGEQHAKEFVDRVVGVATLDARITELEVWAGESTETVAGVVKLCKGLQDFQRIGLGKMKRALRLLNRSRVNMNAVLNRTDAVLGKFAGLEPLVNPDDPFGVGHLGEPG